MDTKASISEDHGIAALTDNDLTYDEQLYIDFMRTELSPLTDNVIELLASK